MSGYPEPQDKKRPSGKQRVKRLSTYLIVLAVLLVAALVGYVAARETTRPAASRREQSSPAVITESLATPTPEPDTTGDWGYRVRWQGESYMRRDKLQTVLFMGVENVQYADQAWGNAGRTDSLALFVLDTEKKTARMIPISRDTIVPVDVYDTTGRKIFSGDMQITMQYSYGDNPKRSALLTERRVGELIHGIDINGYLALTMDGIAPIVDGLGGITLTLDKDYSMIDPAYIAGATVTMNGAAVEHFVRYRDTNTSGSNNARMERQAWVVRQLFQQLRSGGIGVGQLLDLADAYMNTDLDAETLRNFARYELEGESSPLPGESRAGAEHDEFYVDDEAVQALLIEVFYQKVS